MVGDEGCRGADITAVGGGVGEVKQKVPGNRLTPAEHYQDQEHEWTWCKGQLISVSVCMWKNQEHAWGKLQAKNYEKMSELGKLDRLNVETFSRLVQVLPSVVTYSSAMYACTKEPSSVGQNETSWARPMTNWCWNKASKSADIDTEGSLKCMEGISKGMWDPLRSSPVHLKNTSKNLQKQSDRLDMRCLILIHIQKM